MPDDFPISSKRCKFCRNVKMYDKPTTMDLNYVDVCLHPKNIRNTATLHCCKDNCPKPDEERGESYPKVEHHRTPEEIAEEKHIDPNVIRVKKKIHKKKMDYIVSHLMKNQIWLDPVDDPRGLDQAKFHLIRG